LKAQNIYTTVG